VQVLENSLTLLADTKWANIVSKDKTHFQTIMIK